MSDEQQKLLYAVALILLNSGLLGTLVLAARKWLEARVGAERLHAAMGIAYQVVLAVEQIASQPSTILSNQGKLDGAISRAVELGQAHGITLDAEYWQTLIEAAVRSMKYDGPPEVATPPTPPTSLT